jgi:hypothetical protein
VGGAAPAVYHFDLRQWHPLGLRNADSPSWQPRCTRSGSTGVDRMRGGPGSELLCGLGGNDVLSGGAGRDRLFGHGGHDRIDSRDAERDVVGCGPGRDTVQADRVDVVGNDCEQVTRE